MIVTHWHKQQRLVWRCLVAWAFGGLGVSWRQAGIDFELWCVESPRLLDLAGTNQFNPYPFQSSTIFLQSPHLQFHTTVSINPKISKPDIFSWQHCFKSSTCCTVKQWGV